MATGESADKVIVSSLETTNRHLSQKLKVGDYETGMQVERNLQSTSMIKGRLGSLSMVQEDDEDKGNMLA